MKRRLALAAVVLLAARPAAGQTLRAGATVFNAQHRVSVGGAVSDRNGVFFGGGGAVRLGPVELGVSSLMGSLGASDDSANGEATVRSTTVALLVRAAPWLALGGEAEARRFDSDGGASSWVLLGGAVRVSPPMGVAGLNGLIEVSFFASATAKPQNQSIAPAMRGTVGISYAAGGPLELRLGYRFERFDFAEETAGAPRLEQFRGIIAGVGFRTR